MSDDDVSKPRILVVLLADSTEELAIAIERLLADERYDSTVACGLDDALDHLFEYDKFDLVILEIDRLDDPDGLLLKTAGELFMRVLLIGPSGSCNREFSEDVAVHGFLEEPYEVDELMAFVPEVLEVLPPKWKREQMVTRTRVIGKEHPTTGRSTRQETPATGKTPRNTAYVKKPVKSKEPAQPDRAEQPADADQVSGLPKRLYSRRRGSDEDLARAAARRGGTGPVGSGGDAGNPWAPTVVQSNVSSPPSSAPMLASTPYLPPPDGRGVGSADADALAAAADANAFEDALREGKVEGLELAGHVMRYKLGAGAMGVVFLATHKLLDVDVALKLLPPHLAANKTFLERFYREARACAKLDHPNIVRVLNVGEDRGHHFIAMQYVDGPTLRQIMADGGILPIEFGKHCLRQTLLALEHAHARGGIHRDVKPDNLMVNSEGVLKVTDFGLARDFSSGDATLTRSGQVLGTPAYMPIEQWDGESIDHRADLYAAGASFYHLLTGHIPYEGSAPSAILRNLVAGRMTPIREHRADIPPALAVVLTRLLSRDRDARYRNARAAIDEIERISQARVVAPPAPANMALTPLPFMLQPPPAPPQTPQAPQTPQTPQTPLPFKR